METILLCKYCTQTYSRYNEPLLIICLCENTAKYAHGSCFRNWTKFHEYGVCDKCLNKTKIVPDGRRNIKEIEFPKARAKVLFSIFFSILWFAGLLGVSIWMISTQCVDISCIILVTILSVLLLSTLMTCLLSKDIRKFWKTVSINSYYWKIVYCYEETVNKKIRRLYSDVPITIPEALIQKSVYNNVESDNLSYNVDFFDNFGNDVNEVPKFSIWEHTDLPYIKKNPLYLNKEVRCSNHKLSQHNRSLNYSMEVEKLNVNQFSLDESSQDTIYNGARDTNSDLNKLYFQDTGDKTRNTFQLLSGRIVKDYNENVKLEDIWNEAGQSSTQSSQVQKDDISGITEQTYATSRAEKSSLQSSQVRTMYNENYKQLNLTDNVNKISVHAGASRSGDKGQIEKEFPINYINKRADSFFKNERKISEDYYKEKYREMLRRNEDLIGSSNKQHKNRIAGMKRSSSEPVVNTNRSKHDSVYKRFSHIFKGGSTQDVYLSHVGKFRFKNNSEFNQSLPPVMPQKIDIVYGRLEADDHRFVRDNPKCTSENIRYGSQLKQFPVQRVRSVYLPHQSDYENGSLFTQKLNYSRQNSIETTPEPHKSISYSSVFATTQYDSNFSTNIKVKENEELLEQKRISKSSKEEADGSKIYLEGSPSKFESAAQDIGNNPLEENETLLEKNSYKREKNNTEEISKYEEKLSKENYSVQMGKKQNENEKVQHILNTPLEKLDMKELFTDSQLFGKKRPSLFQGTSNKTLFFADK